MLTQSSVVSTLAFLLALFFTGARCVAASGCHTNNSDAPWQFPASCLKGREIPHNTSVLWSPASFAQSGELSAQSEHAAELGNTGNRLLTKGDAKGAAEAYREALKLVPNDPKMHYNLSLALEQLRDAKEEERELEKCVALGPSMVDARNQLGILYMRDGRLAEAEMQFRAASDTDPTNAEAQNNLGSLYVRQGKTSEAIALFQKAIEDDPKYAKALLNWGIVLASEGNYTEAIRLFQNAINVSSDYADAYTALGMAEGKTGQSRKAVQAFTKVLELEPNSSEAHVNLGIALADEYDLQGALAEFSRGVRLNSTSALAHYNKARVLYDMGKREKATAEAETACRLLPHDTQCLYLLGLVERGAGHIAASTAAFNMLVALEPNNASAQFQLGQNLLREGKEGAAIQHWKAAVALDPENTEALYNLARALRKAADPEAETYMDRFQRLKAKTQLSDQVQTLNNFALKAAGDHNWSQAVAQLKEALQLCGECSQLPVLHRNLGLIHAQTGDPEDAIRELSITLRLKPNDADARQAIEILEALQKRKAQSN